MIELFNECDDSYIANCADDTTPFSWATDILTLICELQVTLTKVFNWFDNNHMKANPGKCHLLFSPETRQVVSIGGMAITLALQKLYQVSPLTQNFICNKVS